MIQHCLNFILFHFKGTIKVLWYRTQIMLVAASRKTHQSRSDKKSKITFRPVRRDENVDAGKVRLVALRPNFDRLDSVVIQMKFGLLRRHDVVGFVDAGHVGYFQALFGAENTAAT